MSGYRRSRRGQTALESLFIFALILTGVVLVVPAYLHENSSSFLAAAVRDASAQAVGYLNLGVVNRGDERYSPLNEVITNCADYRSLNVEFIGLGIVSETDTNVTVEVRFVRHPGEEGVDGLLAEAIGRFLQRYLEGVSGFKLVRENGTTHLYYRGRLVEFVVYVNGVRRVVW